MLKLTIISRNFDFLVEVVKSLVIVTLKCMRMTFSFLPVREV